ncbi:hypothetical protein EVAR_87090_1 [Eumeta japonica]|uniref:Uncharacterized protein n=1 Tax=Eumeta variegata TaxID=151549 RepID=A0A4C1VR40_EUMVA|nr:hypothetical protein EVAR_87090_1 [Eumeta japonica]
MTFFARSCRRLASNCGSVRVHFILSINRFSITIPIIILCSIMVPTVLSAPISFILNFAHGLAFDSEPGFELSRFRFCSGSLLSDSGTAARSDINFNFSLALGLMMTSVQFSISIPPDLESRFCTASRLRF